VSRRAVLVACAAPLAFLVVAWLAYPWVFGDTPFVLDGSNALLTCLHHHDYNACGYTGQLNYWGLMSPIGDWPLLQHLPDLIAIGLGASAHATRTRVLEILNVVAVVAMVAVAWTVFARVGRRSGTRARRRARSLRREFSLPSSALPSCRHIRRCSQSPHSRVA
jgi:hypothetical protein